MARNAPRRRRLGPGALLVLSALLLVAFAVAIWAMTAKPT